MEDNQEATATASNSKRDNDTKTSENAERLVINQLAGAALNEQRRSRKWGIFFKLLTFAYIGILMLAFLKPTSFDSSKKSGEHTALVNLNGVIAHGADAGADNIVDSLRNAFEDKNTTGVILRINSPGGSPVQSDQIYREIKRLREKHADIPLYAVITDIGASGGYYVAAAADKIYVDNSSIVGSIGVRMDGFGLVDTIKKLGVERRLLTAGKSKGLLDPFLPINPAEVGHLQGLLNDIHQQFISRVKEGRGDRLKDDASLFSGLVWTGKRAIELGLVDDVGSAGSVARDILKQEDIVDFTKRDDLVTRFADKLGAAISGQVLQTMGAEYQIK